MVKFYVTLFATFSYNTANKEVSCVSNMNIKTQITSLYQIKKFGRIQEEEQNVL
jgi:hypothetical protein